jgi:ribosomal protein L7/L12
MPKKSETISADDQKKLAAIKKLQEELNLAFKEAKNYTGESKEDKAVFDKIKKILDDIAKLTQA